MLSANKSNMAERGESFDTRDGYDSHGGVKPEVDVHGDDDKTEVTKKWKSMRHFVLASCQQDDDLLKWVKAKHDVDLGDMFQVVKAAQEAKTFQEDIELFQNLEKSLKNPDPDEKKDAAPVFNKRLFASQGTVIMTGESRRLMTLNSKANEICDMETVLTKRELQCLRCITEGLKLVHKGHDFVKDVLSRVVSYEVYKAFQYVQHKPWEDSLSCYYILNGAVEVTYDLRSRESRNVYQANIIYSHGTGEYLGLVSPEGPREDLAPPKTIYTKELTQFIRVDRQRFHKLFEKASSLIDKQKRDYIRSRSFLTKVSDKVKEKLLHKFTIQEFPPNRVLLAQGEVTEFLFIIMSGRCQTYREVYIPEADKEVLFYLTSRDTDDFFGEECVLDHDPSTCTVVTATTTVCLKLHRSALQMVNREKLTKFIDAERHEFITDEALRNMGYKDCIWNKYKHGQVKETLKEGGKLCYLNKENCNTVLERPPSDEELYIENKRRFVLKGSQFDPVRVHSAVVRGSNKATFPLRPHTVLGNHVTEETEDLNGDAGEKDGGQTDTMEDTIDSPSKPSALMTASKAKELEKHLDKALESKENLMKMLDDPGELGLHLKQAWKAEAAQETQNFMKNGVLVTMTSEDIVRKAKALADTNADKWKNKKASGEDEEEWNTILHAENKQAKMLITANKLRLKDLKRKMTELQKKRERDRDRRSPRKPYVNSSDGNLGQNGQSPATVAATDSENQISQLEKLDTDSTDSTLGPSDQEGHDKAGGKDVVAIQSIAEEHYENDNEHTSNLNNDDIVGNSSNGLHNTVDKKELSETKEIIDTNELEDTNKQAGVKQLADTREIAYTKEETNSKDNTGADTENTDKLSRDSLSADTLSDLEVKVTKFPSSAASRPDSAIGSMGSEDACFDSSITDIHDTSRHDDSVIIDANN